MVALLTDSGRPTAQRAATIDDADTGLLRVDEETLNDAVVLKGDDIAGTKREHLLFAAEPGMIAQLAIESAC